MDGFLPILLAGIALIAGVGIGWRFASRRYSLPTPVWMRVFLDSPFRRSRSVRIRRTLLRLDLQPGMKVLDAGCGPGRLTVPVAERIGDSGEVTAVDIQEGMLQVARDRARTAGLNNIRFLQTGIGEGQLECDHFDRAILTAVLGEIPHQLAALREVFEALRPGGLLLIEEALPDPHFQSRATIRRLIRTAGFMEEELYENRFSFTMTAIKPHRTRT